MTIDKGSTCQSFTIIYVNPEMIVKKNTHKNAIPINRGGIPFILVTKLNILIHIERFQKYVYIHMYTTLRTDLIIISIPSN